MPLTGKEKMARHRAKIKAQLARGERMEAAVREAAIALEYWAGCSEDTPPDVAYTEILAAGGPTPAAAYDKIVAALNAEAEA